MDEDKDFASELNNVISHSQIPEADNIFTPEEFNDTYLRKEIAIAREAGTEEGVEYGKVTKRLRNAEGRPIGTAHDNPLLDTQEYKVEFRDGHKKSLYANLIAQHLYSQIDDKGNRHVLLDDIINHGRNDSAIDKSDAFVTMSNGVGRKPQQDGNFYANGKTKVPIELL